MKFSARRHDVFLSHSHVDAGRAQEVVADLERRGFGCWLDQDRLRVGQLYDERIQKAITDSAVVLVLISRDAAVSEYVKHEVSSALAAGVPLLALFLEEMPAGSLKAPLDFSDVRRHALRLREGDEEKIFGLLAEGVAEFRETACRALRLRRAGLAAVMCGLMLGGWWLAGGAAADANTEAIPGGLMAGEIAHPFDVLARPRSFGGAGGAVGGAGELSLSVMTLEPDGRTWRSVEPGGELRSGADFFVEVISTGPGWLYVFQQDAAGEVAWVFPRNDATPGFSFGENPLPAGRTVSLPEDRRSAYRLDDTVGLERICAVFSPERLPEFEASLRRLIKPEPGAAVPRLLPGGGGEAMLLARAEGGGAMKGIASVVSLGEPRSGVRALGGVETTYSFRPAVHRSEQGWSCLLFEFNHTAR